MGGNKWLKHSWGPYPGIRTYRSRGENDHTLVRSTDFGVHCHARIYQEVPSDIVRGESQSDFCIRFYPTALSALYNSRSEIAPCLNLNHLVSCHAGRISTPSPHVGSRAVS